MIVMVIWYCRLLIFFSINFVDLIKLQKLVLRQTLIGLANLKGVNNIYIVGLQLNKL
jgi:hypothetical protein